MSIVRELLGKEHDEDLSKKGRIERAEGDFEYFCSTYLPHYFSSPPAPYQLAIYDIITRESVTRASAKTFQRWTRAEFRDYIHTAKKLRGVIDIEPRDHGKSVRMTFAFPLWNVLFKKRKFVVVFGNTDGDARQALENIRFEIEENELLLEDFGDLQGDIWKANLISLSNGTAIAARGKGSSARGLRFHENRPDLVILDDVIKDEEADSREQCDKNYRWVKRVVFNLGKECFIAIVNTHFNDNDPPTRMQQEILKGKLKGFLALRFSAQLEDGTPLWGERWSEADLVKKQSDIGPTPYMIEYLSLSVNEEDKIFRPEWFVYFSPADIDIVQRVITMGVDPNATGADDAAIAVCAYDRVKKYRDIIAWWSKPFGTRREFVERLIDMYLIWSPQQVAFEEVAFQKIYKEFILEACLDRGVMIPMVGIKPGSASKKSRVMQYQPYVESGIMRFANSMKGSAEMDRVQAFPTTGVNDGLLDAIYYAVLASASTHILPGGAASRRKGTSVKNIMRRFMHG